MTLGARIAVMRDGRLEQVGAPLDVFGRPANVFVATFLGSPAMNVWRCTVTKTAGGATLACGALRFQVDQTTAETLGAETVLAGVRPHDIALAGRDDADAVGRVEVMEPLGATAVLHVRLGDERVRIVVPADRAPAVDTDAGIRIPAERVHWFDAQTGVATPRDQST